jgi:hypothetical protein
MSETNEGAQLLLTSVARAIRAQPDPDRLLTGVAERLLQRCDWILADRLEPPDLIVRVAAVADGRILQLPPEMGAAQARRSQAWTVGLLPALAAAPRRMLQIDRAGLEDLARGADADHRAVQARTALALGAHEVLLVGLGVGEDLAGVLTLGAAGSFGEAVLDEVADVATVTGLALDRSRLLSARREVAATIQTRLLPSIPAVDGLQLAARYRPATAELAVGGDWYDAFQDGHRLTIVIGDVSGHDISAAAKMAELRNLLRALAVDRQDSPSDLIRRLERTAHQLGLDSTATCVVGQLEPAAGGRWSLTWSNAGHPPPVLVRGGMATPLEAAPELMLGVDRRTERTDHRESLNVGDRLLLFTDGLVEEHGVSVGEGIARLLRVTETHHDRGLDSLIDRVLSVLAVEPTDDVALLGIAVTEPPR